MSKTISAAYLVRRMMHTKRWGIINTTRQQSVAEHTCGVAILADRLATDASLSTEDHLALLRHVLYHDAFEVVTGDLPGSLKRNHPAIKATIKDLEEGQNEVPVIKLRDATLQQFARAADMAESVIFLDDVGHGARAERVKLALVAITNATGQGHILDETNKLHDDADLGDF